MSSPHHKPIVHIAPTDEPENHLTGNLFRIATMSLTPTSIYATGSSRYIFAMDRASGEQQQVYECHGSYVSNPLVVNGVLYATTATDRMDSHGIIEAWRLSDSASLWQFSMPRRASYVYSPLVVADGVSSTHLQRMGVFML